MATGVLWKKVGATKIMINSDHTRLISNFYESFKQGDAEGMVACYDDEISFSDPAFGNLKGSIVGNMWRMLIEKSKGDLLISYSDVHADDQFGSARWNARYTFGKTGRKVVNRISANFEFHNGKIIKHTDNFNMWQWSMQAFGWKGFIFGWTPFMRNQIQKQTKHLLNKYSESRL